MSKKGRDTLKSFFRKGNLPREGQFADLIDSMVNSVDDGISSTVEDGLQITPLDEGGRLLSFYDGPDANRPHWIIRLDRNNNILSVCNRDGEQILNFTDHGNIGIGTRNPKSRLDVNGRINMTARKGTYGKLDEDIPLRVPANGKWQPLLTGLDGCRAFEIMAGTGVPKTGRYALLHAIAMNCFNGNRGSIKKVHTTYRWFWHKIALRWRGSKDNYRLEIKTWMNYGDSAMINCHVTDLWDDPFMNNAQNQALIKGKAE